MTMTKKVLFTAAAMLTAAASPTYAATLFDNGPIVNGAGVSILTAPASTFGFTSSAVATLADNFGVTGAGWNVSSIDFYAYQTQAGTGVFTFTSATWSVVRGTDVNTGVVVASGTTAVTNGGLVGYRTLDTAQSDRNRAIFRVSADVTDFGLSAGNYFLTWALAGTSPSGPFVPPVAGSPGTGNALQALTGLPFSTITESGSGQTVDLPFTINGTFAGAAVPEPASWAMMILGMGAVGFTLRRRAKVVTRVSYAV